MKSRSIFLQPLFFALFGCFGLAVLPAQHLVSTYAGSGVNGIIDGDTSTAAFSQPCDIVRDRNNNLIIIDQNGSVRKISPAGIVTTLAGTGVAGYQDGPGASAQFNNPLSGCVDTAGNVFVSDFLNQRIRKIDVNGNVTTVAGNGVAGYKDSTALESSFNYPRGICVDLQGNLYVSDSWNHRIRKIDTTGNVTTFAGGGNSFGVQSPGAWVDGPDTTARFWTPTGLEIDAVGNIYLADAYNHRIRKITPQGVVSTLAGNGPGGSTQGAFQDGPLATAWFDTPVGLCLDANGGIYVADLENYRLRYVSNGMVSTVAGDGVSGYLDGPSLSAEFTRIRDVVGDATGNVFYISDALNRRIRKLSLNAIVAVQPGPDADREGVLYPHPASEGVFLDRLMGGQIADVQVYDLHGRRVLVRVGHPLAQALDLRGLAAGCYVLELRGEVGVRRVRLVKE